MISVYDKKENCCGCTACKSICSTKAIYMGPDEEGFLYPKINQELCKECGLCKEICAFQQGYDVSHNFAYPYIYAAKHIDEKVRMNSSSGGFFTAISDYVLGKKGVVFGATFDDDMYVVHRKASVKEDRDRFRGSKYVQSDLGNTFRDIKDLLEANKLVLFSGTPCQIAGLKNYLRGVNTENLILCDIICHGTPSPLIWKEHIAFLEAKEKRKVLEYNCRCKLLGWHNNHEMVVYENGKEDYQSTLSQIHKVLFYSRNTLRPSCYRCRYTNLKRPSDITMADFWGIEKCMPEIDDNKGVSLVLINTQKGKNIFENIKAGLEIWESNTSDCLQPNLQYPTKRPNRRDQFWRDYYKHGFEYIAKKYAGYSFKGKIKRPIKSLLRKIGILDKIRNYWGAK